MGLRRGKQTRSDDNDPIGAIGYEAKGKQE